MILVSVLLGVIALFFGITSAGASRVGDRGPALFLLLMAAVFCAASFGAVVIL